MDELKGKVREILLLACVLCDAREDGNLLTFFSHSAPFSDIPIHAHLLLHYDSQYQSILVDSFQKNSKIFKVIVVLSAL